MARKDCPECGGTGWRPVESGGVHRVARCACVVEERSGHLLAQAGIPRRYEHCSFDNYSLLRDHQTGRHNQSLEKAKIYAQRFVEDYPIDIGLLFVGPTGVGKTHLAVAVLRELILRKSVECLFYDFRELLQQIRESYNPVSQSTEYSVLGPVLESEVLLLDELVSSNPSDWVKETLARIINSRYNQKKVTLITTTLPLAQSSPRTLQPSGEEVPSLERSLDQFGVTLSSRLYEMCKVVEMHSDDFRRTIKQAGYRFQAE